MYPFQKKCTPTRKSLLLWRDFSLFIGRVLLVWVPSLLHKIVSFWISTGRGYSKHCINVQLWKQPSPCCWKQDCSFTTIPPTKYSHVLNESGIFQKKIALIVPTQNVQPKQKNLPQNNQPTSTTMGIGGICFRKKSCWCQDYGDFPERGKTGNNWKCKKIQLKIFF